jgi:hypothetical protein
MLIRLIVSPADEHRSGANQMRQHLSFREHFRGGNALLIQIAALRLGLRGGRIADDLDPVSELHSLDQFWQLVLAVDPAPTLLGALDKLEDHGERRLVDRQPFDRMLRCRTVAKVLSMGFVTGMRIAVPAFPAYGATIRDEGAPGARQWAGR